jgi:hypothetical protein
MLTTSPVQLWRIRLDPTPDAAGIYRYAPFRYDLGDMLLRNSRTLALFSASCNRRFFSICMEKQSGREASSSSVWPGQAGNVLVSQRIAKVPSHTQKNQLARVLASLERVGWGDRHEIPSLPNLVPKLRNGTGNVVSSEVSHHAVGVDSPLPHTSP